MRIVSLAILCALALTLAAACGDDSGGSVSVTPAVNGPIVTPVAAAAAKGSSIDARSGLLLPNGSGGGKLWRFPDGATIGEPSRDGRYVPWNDPPRTPGTPSQAHILDTSTGNDIPLGVNGERVFWMRILGSGDAVLAVGSARVYVLALPSFQQLQVANIPTGFQTLQAAFKHSPDGRWVAVTIGDGQRAATLFASKDAIRTAPDGGDVAWTRDSRRAAVIGAARGYLLDVAAGTGVPVAQGGFGPNWSDDGAYVAFGLATAASGGNDAISVVDGSSGVEVLRVYGPKACVPTGVQWGPQNTIRAAGSRNAEKAFVQVPGGQFLKQAPPDIRPPAPTPPAPPDVRLPPGVALVQPLTWLSEHDWRDGRASNGFVLSEGGGKDFCLEEPADASVVLPPFTPDRLPSPAPAVTPTVTRSPS